MHFIQSIFAQSPLIPLFLSLAGGFAIGKIRFGKFQLGGVAGSLLVAVLVSQVGVHIDNGVKAILFALFIYAVGFESGPQFFKSLGRQTLREIAMSVVLAVSALITVIVLAKMFHLDRGMAAGIAAGGLTQSAIIGTAGSAIAKLGLSPAETQHLQANVAIGYAVTYIFGSLGAILVCANFMEMFMGRTLREDALKAEAEMLAGSRVLAAYESIAAPELIGRIYKVEQAAGKSVADIESLEATEHGITVERVKRDNKIIEVSPKLVLEPNDLVLLVGRRTGVVSIGSNIGSEQQSSNDMDVVMALRDITITSPALKGKTISAVKDSLKGDIRHGVYLTQIKSAGKPVPMKPDTVVHAGDVVTLYGTDQDLKRVAGAIGPMLVPSEKTDWVFHSLGLVVGLLIGLGVVRIGSIPLTLGSGGGALLSGLVFGWYQGRHMTIGNMPSSASTLLRDLGLAGFVAVIGLQAGQQAVHTIMEQGMTIFLLGCVVTILPLIITMFFGRFVLKYDNAAVFAGALAGSRSANPAFGEVLEKAGNSIPTTPFAITYALANVFLTLLGPLIVALS